MTSPPSLLFEGRNGVLLKCKLLILTAIATVIATTGTATAQARANHSNSTKHSSLTYTQRTICRVFGRYCSQALRVSYCESRYSVYARNGQYLGLFQMGDFARGRYGNYYTAYGQSIAAYHYFRDSGYDWSPWECKPW